MQNGLPSVQQGQYLKNQSTYTTLLLTDKESES